jgi:hypothetical protein
VNLVDITLDPDDDTLFHVQWNLPPVVAILNPDNYVELCMMAGLTREEAERRLQIILHADV